MIKNCGLLALVIFACVMQVYHACDSSAGCTMVPGSENQWLKWSNCNQNGVALSRTCPPGQLVDALEWREWGGYGLVDVVLSCNGSQLDITGNTGGWNNRKAGCATGFSAIKGREEASYGVVNAEMLCYETDLWTRSNENFNGFWTKTMTCPEQWVITGLEVREHEGHGIVNFRPLCSKLVQKPDNPPVPKTSEWTEWANTNAQGFTIMELCPDGYAVEALQWEEEPGFGLVELFMDCGYGGIAFTRNTNGGKNPEVRCDSADQYGFSAVKGKEQPGYGIIDAGMQCRNSDTWVVSSNNTHTASFWNDLDACSENFIVTGLEVREQHGYGIINFRTRCTEWDL